MSAYSQRQSEILAKVQARGTCSIEDLSQQFSVSTQTIRRDVNQLCEFGELRRVRGGVTLPPKQSISTPSQADQVLSDKHCELAEKVASLIPDNASLSIVSSPMMISVIHALRGKTGLKIFTNDLAIALHASKQAGWQITIAGGMVAGAESEQMLETSKAVSSPRVASFFERFEADFGLIQASAISKQGNLLERREEDAEILQSVFSHAQQTLLLIDHEQLDPSAHVRAGHLSAAHEIISDHPLDFPDNQAA